MDVKLIWVGKATAVSYSADCSSTFMTIFWHNGFGAALAQVKEAFDKALVATRVNSCDPLLVAVRTKGGVEWSGVE